MSLTVAISTHGGYDKFLAECVRSALPRCDQLVVYDDGGECTPRGGRHVNLPKSGSLIAARIKAIEDCKTTHLLHMDADDVLYERPEPKGDIYFAPLHLVKDGLAMHTWTWSDRPTDYTGCVEWMGERLSTPFPISKAVFRIEWVRENGLCWYRWPSTTYAEDAKTLLEYLKCDPEVVYEEKPYYGYRLHDSQMTGDIQARRLFEQDLSDYIRGLDVR